LLDVDVAIQNMLALGETQYFDVAFTSSSPTSLYLTSVFQFGYPLENFTDIFDRYELQKQIILDHISSLKDRLQEIADSDPYEYGTTFIFAGSARPASDHNARHR